MQKLSAPTIREELVFLGKLKTDLKLFNQDRVNLISTYIDKVLKTQIITDLATLRSQLTPSNDKLNDTYDVVKLEAEKYVEQKILILNGKAMPTDPWFAFISESNNEKVNQSFREASNHVRDILFTSQTILANNGVENFPSLSGDLHALNAKMKRNYLPLLKEKTNEDKKLAEITAQFKKLEEYVKAGRYDAALKTVHSLQTDLQNLTEASMPASISKADSEESASESQNKRRSPKLEMLRSFLRLNDGKKEMEVK